jgi:V8-like Glu-specific endopeptidase
MYKGQRDYARKFKVLRAIVHPAWNGSPSNGFDYGIGILGEAENDNSMPETHDDYFVSPVENADQYDVRGKMGRVIGFPGSWGDTMTEMNGRFTECRTSRRGQYTGVSLWYDIDQTGGNSGGPVFTIDSGLVS